jgi:AraC-like DNA-binding protein
MYQQFDPHHTLAPFIDAYWQSAESVTDGLAQRIMPDGCMDIIINLGSDLVAAAESPAMRSGKAYLLGTMLRYKDIAPAEGSHLVGIRFKPAAFSHFYSFSSLHELIDQTVEFEKRLTPVIPVRPNLRPTELTDSLNRWFIERLSIPRRSLLTMVHSIYRSQGQLSVEALAREHFTSIRWLERAFKQFIGVSPKEFISFVRYRHALQQIRKTYGTKSLSDIAYECGYYDHAHLGNEIKKYSGIAPSHIVSFNPSFTPSYPF